MKPTYAIIVLVFFLFSACGPHQKNATPPILTPQMDPQKNVHVLPPTHIVGSQRPGHLDLDDESLFKEAVTKQKTDQCAQAIVFYSHLIREFPESSLVLPSLYNRGLCLDQEKQFKAAANSYQTLIRQFPGSTDVKDALFRLAGSFEKTGDHSQVVATVDELLKQFPSLLEVEKVEALARKGSALLALQKTTEAKLHLEEAIRTYKYGKDILPTDSASYFAMAQFKLGELLHHKMRAIELPADESILQAVLEEKASLLLDAQGAYTKTIKIDVTKWAAAAAYRIGALYHHLWVDMLAAPLPADLNQEEREIYREILQNNIRILLRKSMVQWERTLKMGSRLGLDNEWMDKTKQDLEQIRSLLEPPTNP